MNNMSKPNNDGVEAIEEQPNDEAPLLLFDKDGN